MRIDEEYEYLPLDCLTEIINRLDDLKSLAIAKNVNRTWHREVIKNNNFKARLIDHIQTLLQKNVRIDFKIEYLKSKNSEFLIRMADVITKKAGHPEFQKAKVITKYILGKRIIALMMDQYIHQFSAGTINLRLVDRPNSPYFILFGFYLLSALMHYTIKGSADRNFLTSFIFAYEVYVTLIEGFIKYPYLFISPVVVLGGLFCISAITVFENTSLLYQNEVVREIGAAIDAVPTSSIASPTEIMTLAWSKNLPFGMPKTANHEVIEIDKFDSEVTLSIKKNQ